MTSELVEGLCAIDAGTTGCRAAVFGVGGDMISVREGSYAVAYGAGGTAEQDPDDLWQGICSAVRDSVESARRNGVVVRAVSVASQRASVVAVDANWKPLTPFLLWMDRRGREELEQFSRQVDPERFHRLSGLPLDPMIGLAKLLWLRVHDPATVRRASRFLSLQSWLLQRLGCEDAACDASSAAWLGLYGLEAGGWHKDLVAASGLKTRQLGTVLPSGCTVGRVSGSAAAETGLSAGTDIVLGGGDQQCSAAGAGAVVPGITSVNLGTAAVVVIPASSALLDEERGFITAPHVAVGLHELEGTVPSCGSVYRWLGEFFGLGEGDESYEALNAAAGRAPMGADGLLVVPSFMGLGTPRWRDAEGSVDGLSLRHGREHFVRATIEGILHQIRDVVDHASILNVELGELRAIGGGSRSPLWCQMLADVVNRPITRVANNEGALMGAALCAAVGAGVERDVASAARRMVRLGERFEPSRAAVDFYQEAHATFDAFLLGRERRRQPA